ncbi:membrane protein [Chelonobacter oris]|uniref:Membrane protein n=1 Tax=Chelonobacter oris TaxID=505317 RepID=A0A0A3AQG7_9PAST|nr:anti-phage protein KwaA [Chelonobacter oris]KGQ70027.1 membrane protein [Chelonobacter oris]
MTNTRQKIDLYILSLGLLFIFFFIISVEPPTSFFFEEFESWENLVMNNPLPVISIFGLLYCLFAYLRFDFDLKGANEIPFEVKKLENINYEHLTFLATYVVPLISFDFDSGRQLIVLALLLVVMGIIYIKTDLFYANPSLALLGFHIYRASGHFKNGEREGITLICRERLVENQRVSYIKLDEKIYYVRSVK